MNSVFITDHNGMVGVQQEPNGEFSVWIDPYSEFDFVSLDVFPFPTEDAAITYLAAQYGYLQEYTE